MKAQDERCWLMNTKGDLRSLSGRTVGIIGVGHTGQELIKRLLPFNVSLICYSRNKKQDFPYECRYLESDKGDSLDELLVNSDIIVLACSLSDKTYRMIGERQLKLMKKDAMLINMARGGLIDEKALIAHLQDEPNFEVGLDTFESEPLYPDSPLWALPNCYITPHTTPPLPDRTDTSISIIAENKRRFEADLPLLNQATERDVWTQTPVTDWAQRVKYIKANYERIKDTKYFKEYNIKLDELEE